MYQLTSHYYKQLFLSKCFTISICFSLSKALSTFKQELTEDPIIRVCVCHECRIMFYLNAIVLYLFKRLDYEFKWRLPLSELAGWTNAVIKRVPLLISTFQPEIQDKTHYYSFSLKMTSPANSDFWKVP